MEASPMLNLAGASPVPATLVVDADGEGPKPKPLVDDGPP